MILKHEKKLYEYTWKSMLEFSVLPPSNIITHEPPLFDTRENHII